MTRFVHVQERVIPCPCSFEHLAMLHGAMLSNPVRAKTVQEHALLFLHD